MGASLAVLGGYCLAGEISKAGLDAHPAKALEAYDQAFRKFVEEQQHVPSIFPGVVFPTKSWQRWLLQSTISLLSQAIKLSWIVSWLPEREPAVDFVLPAYPSLEQTKAAEK